jgi:hypothetical protein
VTVGFATKLGGSRYLPSRVARYRWIADLGGTASNGTFLQYINRFDKGMNNLVPAPADVYEYLADVLTPAVIDFGLQRVPRLSYSSWVRRSALSDAYGFLSIRVDTKATDPHAW